MPAIVENYKLAFFSVPKAGSTSMKMVLWHLKTGEEWKNEPDLVHPQFRTRPLKDSDFDDLGDYFRFTIVRDPVGRLLSSYGNRVHAHHDLDKVMPATGRKRILWRLRNPKFSPRPGPNRFFSNLNYFQRMSYSIWHHTTSLSSFIGTDLSRYHRVFKLEELRELETHLESITGTRISLPREQTAGKKITVKDLSAAAREAVEHVTADDYRLLRDYYKSPFQQA